MSLTQLSPGVNVREFDLTGIVPNVGMSQGATVGDYKWGPVEKVVNLDHAKELETIFGKPTDANSAYWFSAFNFLAYSGSLKLVRAADGDALNANSDDDETGHAIQIKNEDHFDIIKTAPQGFYFAAKYPGLLGNTLEVQIADHQTFDTWEYKDFFDLKPGSSPQAEEVELSDPNIELGDINDEIHVAIIDREGAFSGVPGSILERFQFLSKASDAKTIDNAPNYYVDFINRNSRYVWAFDMSQGSLFSSVRQDGQMMSIELTAGGSDYPDDPDEITVDISGGGGTGAEAKVTVSGGVIMSVEVTNPGTGYTSAPTISFVDTSTGGTGSGATATAEVSEMITNRGDDWGLKLQPDDGTPVPQFASLISTYKGKLEFGQDSTLVGRSELIRGYELFQDKETTDISLVFLGPGGPGGTNSSNRTVGQWVLDNVCHRRRDCMLFISPDLDDVLNLDQHEAASRVVRFRQTFNRSSSFAAMDSGWKLQYDVYNDKYRWVPLNADIAGLCARTDRTNDPWWSPGGYVRGRIKNIVSLAFNPNQTSRDTIFKNGINPVVTFLTDGTILYGDKTLLARPSAFDQIGVRRLFIILQKAIAKAAKYYLFEFNDQFTRAAFKNMVEPYLREVKGRRGMYDFKVVCDETNNTPEIIMRNEFVASIFIKPQYSIRWITLNFVAIRRDVEFEEVAGGFGG